MGRDVSEESGEQISPLLLSLRSNTIYSGSIDVDLPESEDMYGVPDICKVPSEYLTHALRLLSVSEVWVMALMRSLVLI